MNKVSGIYKFGLYNYLGAYYANSVLQIAEKIARRKIELNPFLALEIFHAYYLLNLDKVHPLPRGLEKLVEIVKPIEADKDVRMITVLDDKLSRIAAAKFIVVFEEEIKKKLEEVMRKSPDPVKNKISNILKLLSQRQEMTEGNMEIFAKDLEQAIDLISSSQELVKTFTSAVRSAAVSTSDTVKNVKAVEGILAGVGHSITFDDLSWVQYTKVDLNELLRLFTRISALFEKAMIESRHGEVYGRRYGRDLQKIAPSALVMDDDEFYIRYATGRLPVKEQRVSKEESIIVVIDKSGSMDTRNKTLWSRAVALALGRLAAKGFYSDAKVLFFDESTYPNKPISLKTKEAIKMITSIKCDGGTSIDTALKTADDGRSTIILITDGEDKVTYKPRSRLISVMIDGDNTTLATISDRYLKVEPDEKGALKILDVLKERRWKK
jgi:uncharacterized protein with von Willebrand factor type A (vWA) domain